MSDQREQQTMTAPNGKLASEMERIVLGRVASGRLVVPSMPAIATRALAILREPEFHHKKLVTQVEGEPLLAALILRAANAAAFGGAALRGIDQAVVRLGAQKLKTLVVEYASRQLFQSNDRRIADAARSIWEHSIAVAHLARDVAAFADNADGDAAYLAGLLHDVGKPVVAAMLLEAERSIGRDTSSWLGLEAWAGTVEAVHRKVGVAIASQWKLPDEITAAIRDCSDYDAGNRGSIANIVRFANAVAKREGFTTGPIDAADVDAMIMVGRSILGADEDVVARLATGLKDRLALAAA
jgi:putative nucleotidyltransferase with HDIG domain